MREFILVLDEDNDIVTAISGFLRNQGLDVHAFTDPVAALEDLNRRDSYDKFLQDVQKKIDDADRSEVAHDRPRKC